MPALGLGIVKVVEPPASVCVIGVPLSTLSETVPVGMPDPELTVIVTMPFALYVTPGALSVTVVPPGPTLNVPDAELAPKFPCAAYTAFKVWLPKLGLGIVKVEEPLLSDSVCAAPPSTLNDTVPVGVPDIELTVTATEPFEPYVTTEALIIIDVGAIAGSVMKMKPYGVVIALPATSMTRPLIVTV